MTDGKKGSKFTFDSFEVTKANSKALEKAKQFTENADSKPLAIFGGTATGKTHLLYAVKNAIEQNSPELHVILTTTADMVSSLTNIISNGGTAEQFRECRRMSFLWTIYRNLQARRQHRMSSSFFSIRSANPASVS